MTGCKLEAMMNVPWQCQPRKYVAIGIVLAVAAALIAAAQGTDDSVTSWAYGVVVWPDHVGPDVGHFTDRLTAAAKEAFAFWGHAPPEAAGVWECPLEYAGGLHCGSADVRIVDDRSAVETVVPPLQWMNRQLFPVVVIAFSGGWRMRDALGTTATFGARFHFGSAASSYPDAEDWVREVGRGRRTMICVSYAGDEFLIHEFAHWFLAEWCEASGVNPWRLPDVIHEGTAEATCASAKDSTDTVWEHRAVIDWAKRNCLSNDVGAASVYTVGKSLVTHLIDELGEAGFLETLAVWASSPDVLIAQYEPEWRESLGLPRECVAASDGSG
jgi:hypothetical protein